MDGILEVVREATAECRHEGREIRYAKGFNEKIYPFVEKIHMASVQSLPPLLVFRSCLMANCKTTDQCFNTYLQSFEHSQVPNTRDKLFLFFFCVTGLFFVLILPRWSCAQTATCCTARCTSPAPPSTLPWATPARPASARWQAPMAMRPWPEMPWLLQSTGEPFEQFSPLSAKTIWFAFAVIFCSKAYISFS